LVFTVAFLSISWPLSPCRIRLVPPKLPVSKK
jgi:hypothetical protein